MIEFDKFLRLKYIRFGEDQFWRNNTRLILLSVREKKYHGTTTIIGPVPTWDVTKY